MAETAHERGPIGGARSDQSRIQRFRIGIGIAACIGFAINFVMAQITLMSARGGDASAIQIIQVWTPHIYYAILITGIAVALYIASRSMD